MDCTYTIFTTPIGELLIAGTEQAVTLVTCDADAFMRRNPCYVQAESGSLVGKAANVIRAYLNGMTCVLNLPIHAEGTAFQKNVWQELCCIPFGKTSTYAEIAERIGKPSAFRAVANACGKNPMPILIPCHRAVHKDGRSSGFNWSVEIKQFLLHLEMAKMAIQKAA